VAAVAQAHGLNANLVHIVWPNAMTGAIPALTQAQFDELVLGLPWQRLQHMQVITQV
jgi:hypothetical protein